MSRDRFLLQSLEASAHVCGTRLCLNLASAASSSASIACATTPPPHVGILVVSQISGAQHDLRALHSKSISFQRQLNHAALRTSYSTQEPNSPASSTWATWWVRGMMTCLVIIGSPFRACTH